MDYVSRVNLHIFCDGSESLGSRQPSPTDSGFSQGCPFLRLSRGLAFAMNVMCIHSVHS